MSAIMVDRPGGEDGRFLKVNRRDAFPEDFRLATVAEAKKFLSKAKASAKGGGSSAALRPGRGEAFRLKDGYLFEFGTLKSFYPDLEEGGVKLTYKLGIRRSLSPDLADMNDLDVARALLHACYEDDEEEVRVIFNRHKGQDGEVGALRVNTPWYNGGNAFHLCSHLGKLNILSLLLHQHQQAKGGCPPGQISPLRLPDNNGDTPFSHAAACKADNSALVMELLKHEECAKLSINQCNLMGFTPLMVAVDSGHANTCRELLSAQGIDVNSTDAVGNTILHLCALRSDAGDILEVLWNDPRVLKLMSKQNIEGQTPLTQALKAGRSEFCLHVLRRDVDANVLTAHANPHQDSFGYNILHFLALGGCERSVGDLLLEVLGSSTEQLINKADILGRPPFVLATVHENFDAWAALWRLSDKEAIKQFLDDETGDNILHYYARSPKLVGSTGKELVDHMRELVNVSNDAGFTPIMYALRSGHTDACVLLLKVADLQLDINNKIYTHQGNILHMYAKGGAGEAAGEELMRRLRDKNIKALITQQDSKGRTPLMIALSNGHTLQASYILQLCAKYGISVSLKEVDAKGNNIFHFWCMCKQANAELLKKLISFGTEEAVTDEFINAQNAEGDTPLMCALRNGNTELCRLLFEGNYVRVHVLQNETLHPKGRNVFHYFAMGSCEDAIVWEKLKGTYDPGKLPTVLNAQDKKYGITPLMYALGSGCSAACPMLFLREDSVVVNDLKDTDGDTVLQWLAYASSIHNSEFLLEFRRREWSKRFLHSTNKSNTTALMDAASGGSLMLFEMLLEEVDSTDFLAKEDSQKHNLLHLVAESCAEKSCSFFQLLKASHAGEKLVTSLLHKKDSDCRTPLMLAACWKNAPACGWLLENLGDKASEAVQTYIDNTGSTALHLAADNIYPDEPASTIIATIRVMLSKIPDRKQALKRIRDKRQQTVLHTAIASWALSRSPISNAPLLHFLLQECAELKDQEEENGYKPLFFAAMHQDSWAMHLLSERNPRQLQERHIISKQTLLHAAASGGYVIAVRKVLDICGDLMQISRFVDAEGKTALHVACKAGNIGAVRVLLKTSKDLANSKTSGRKTPLHEAARAGKLPVVKELLRVEVRGEGNTLLSERDADGRTALHFAAASISENEDEVLQVVQLLLKYEEDQKEAGSKALLLYASAGHAVGTAHDVAKSSKVREYLSKEMDTVQSTTHDLLELAKKMKIVSMVKELINRGARLDNADPDYLQYLQVEKGKEADQPAMKDFLGKTKLAKGIAALLLNPFTAIPINIGIFGPWGMGKSSLMLQIEISLLLTIIKRNLVLSSHMHKGFPGLMKDVLSRKGKQIQEKFVHEINRNSKATIDHNASRGYGIRFKGFLPQIMKVFSRLCCLWKGSNVPQTFEDTKDKQNLEGLLSSYNNDLHPLYKGLALADRSELVCILRRTLLTSSISWIVSENKNKPFMFVAHS